ncbi:MAG: acyl-CoA thioesterase [Bacteroidia bacterium]|nr:acyl-CoA thioesterase [Bacteroidia bacterium]NNJ55925.1 acyl-CoA thioesterase [Bacteroidia bacterium]
MSNTGKKSYKTLEESQITLSELMVPVHSNFGGKIHGGYILGLMDQVAFACASRHSGNYCVTASVNKVDFLHPVEVGELLILKASINYTGNTSMVVGVRVESENIQTGKINHCNSSYFTMVAKDEKGLNVPVPGIVITDNQGIRRFVRSVKRQEQTKLRANTFDESKFDASQYIELLRNHNVQINL